MASAADLKFTLSGGAANTDPALALGGVISTAGGGIVLSQSATASTLGGITYNDASGNSEGAGTMTYTTSGTTLQWTPPGGAIGGAVNIGVSGDYTVYGADLLSHVKVTSVSGSLGGDNTQSVTIANLLNNLFDDVPVVESSAGDIEYRCFYIKNTHASESMTSTLLWIDVDAIGSDSLAIGLDAAGLNGTAITIVDENTAPVGAVFTSPLDEVTALNLGTLAFGDYYAVWIRRTVPSTTNGTPLDTSRLKARFV